MDKKLKTNTVGLKELRTNLETYISRVDKGESFTVIRRSRPVFKIAPVEDESLWETAIDFTEINPNGVKARDVLKALQRLNAQT